jgi:hypothetical protein
MALAARDAPTITGWRRSIDVLGIKVRLMKRLCRGSFRRGGFEEPNESAHICLKTRKD